MEEIDGGEPPHELAVVLLAVVAVGVADRGEQVGQVVDRPRVLGGQGPLGDEHREGVGLPDPLGPQNHMPSPASRFLSRRRQKRSMTPTTSGFMLPTDSRSKPTFQNCRGMTWARPWSGPRRPAYPATRPASEVVLAEDPSVADALRERTRRVGRAPSAASQGASGREWGSVRPSRRVKHPGETPGSPLARVFRIECQPPFQLAQALGPAVDGELVDVTSSGHRAEVLSAGATGS